METIRKPLLTLEAHVLATTLHRRIFDELGKRLGCQRAITPRSPEVARAVQDTLRTAQRALGKTVLVLDEGSHLQSYGSSGRTLERLTTSGLAPYASEMPEPSTQAPETADDGSAE